jgi:hypothetical protein
MRNEEARHPTVLRFKMKRHRGIGVSLKNMLDEKNNIEKVARYGNFPYLCTMIRKLFTYGGYFEALGHCLEIVKPIY